MMVSFITLMDPKRMLRLTRLLVVLTITTNKETRRMQMMTMKEWVWKSKKRLLRQKSRPE